MADIVVVLEMVLETPLIVEGAQTQVAKHLMTPGIVEVIIESVAIFEDALAEVAVVLVFWALLDVVEERGLIRELERAYSTPVLVRVWDLVCAVRCGG